MMDFSLVMCARLLQSFCQFKPCPFTIDCKLAYIFESNTYISKSYQLMNKKKLYKIFLYIYKKYLPTETSLIFQYTV